MTGGPLAIIVGDKAGYAGRPAVFLDRDGVLIANRADHVKRPNEVMVVPGAMAAVRRITDAGAVPVVVTNQGAVGRGLMTLADAIAVQEHVIGLYDANQAVLGASYLCPHAPAARCACRKPAPGMITAAARELSLDLRRSLLVGDALSDIQAARRAGIPAILVLSGRGRDQLRLATRAQLESTRVRPSLAEAVEDVLSRMLVHIGRSTFQAPLRTDHEGR